MPTPRAPQSFSGAVGVPSSRASTPNSGKGAMLSEVLRQAQQQQQQPAQDMPMRQIGDMRFMQPNQAPTQEPQGIAAIRPQMTPGRMAQMQAQQQYEAQMRAASAPRMQQPMPQYAAPSQYYQPMVLRAPAMVGTPQVAFTPQMPTGGSGRAAEMEAQRGTTSNFNSFRDMIDGGGPGRSGPTFQGGIMSAGLSRAGISPAQGRGLNAGGPGRTNAYGK